MLFAIQTTTHHVIILGLLIGASLGAYALQQNEAGFMFAGAAVGAATIRDDRKPADKKEGA